MSAAVTINRPIKDVFDYVTDIPRETEWFTGMRAVRRLSRLGHGTGTEYEFRMRLWGYPFSTLMRVTDFAPPGRMTMLSIRSPITFSATYSFEPLPDGGTLVRLDAHVIGGSVYRLLGPAFLPMLRVAISRRFALLKQRMEAPA